MTFLSKPLLEKRLGNNPAAFISYLKSEVVGIGTGLERFDACTRGLRGLVFFVGEPKSHKSTLVMQIAVHNAVQGNPVYVLDRELGLSIFQERVLCHLTERPLSAIKELSPEKLGAMLDHMRENYPFHFDSAIPSFESLAEDIDKLMQAYPGKPVTLVVDSLQALPRVKGDVRASVDDWLLKLDQLKLTYDNRLAILLTSEKGRAHYGQAVKGGAKESGKIEYAGSYVFDMRLNDDTESIIITCLYNRHGPSNFKVELDRIYKQAGDPWSFIFKLKEREGLGL